ncbi:putative outer membrane protein pmp14 [Labeo rohita]|uniref:Outer membrane protein pmp14 n=1 Tax=Labeo rohita TaxID=84645 RepID=A0ABQ8MJ70_LABRO|nr:putative outer membrane protein pmp14 [Labeo rohita]
MSLSMSSNKSSQMDLLASRLTPTVTATQHSDQCTMIIKQFSSSPFGVRPGAFLAFQQYWGTVPVRHQDVVLTHMKELGLRLNAKKSVLSPLQRTTYLGMVWDRPRCRHVFLLLGSSHPRGSQESESRLTPTVVAQDQGVLPEEKPVLHDQGHAAMPACLGHGLVLGDPCRCVTLATDASLIQLGTSAPASSSVGFFRPAMHSHPTLSPSVWMLENHLSGVVWDLTMMQARLSPARFESILTAVARVREGQSLTVKQFQQLLGLMAAASNMITFGLLYIRPLQWWLRTNQFSLRGNPFHNIKLGSGHEWPPCPWSVEWLPSHVAHQLPGDAGRVSGKHFLPDLRDRHVLVRTHTTQRLSTTGRSAFAPLVQAGAPDPCVVPGQTVEAGAEARGMDASPRDGEADLESDFGIAMFLLVLSDSSSFPGARCYGTDMAEASSVRLSPDRSALGSSGESAPGRGLSTPSSPMLASPSMFPGPDFPSRLHGDSRQERSPLSAEVVETILHPLFTSWCGHHQQDPVNCLMVQCWSFCRIGSPQD